VIILAFFRIFTLSSHTGSLNKQMSIPYWRIDCSQNRAIINWLVNKCVVPENLP
jgi:hypothetical protein